MSGSHQFYTATGRALPPPPKRTPSRHSAVLRLPTRRAEQKRSTTVRTDSPGRIEMPHGGEFRTIPETQRAASQLVVYQGMKKERGRQTAASSKASSVTRGNPRKASFRAAAADTVAAPPLPEMPSTPLPAAKTSSYPSSVLSDLSPPPNAPPLQRESFISVNKANYKSSYQDTASVGERESSREVPKPKKAANESSSDSSSPCLNRMKPTEDDDEVVHQDVNWWRRDSAYRDATSDVQSISMSSTRQSRALEEREQMLRSDNVGERQQRSKQYQAHNSNNDYCDYSVPSQYSVSQYSERPEEQDARRASQKREFAPKPQQQQQQSRQLLYATPPALHGSCNAATAASVALQHSEFSGCCQGPLSHGYSASEASSRRPASSDNTNHKNRTNKDSTSSDNTKINTDKDNRSAVAPVFVSPIVPCTNSGSRSNINSHHYHQSNIGSRSNSNTRCLSVDRHTHLYSQRKMEQRRTSRSAVSVDASCATSFQPPAASQTFALVPAPAVVKYSTRSPRSDDDDPLEMNTPIADRVRQRSVVSSNCMTSGGSAAPPTALSTAGTLEGTELLPSLPKLQGRKTNSSNDDDRIYRTIVRFIEYQPEAERPKLEGMLRDFCGREEELCELLTETYGDDFEMVKLACHRGPSVPLIADRPLKASSAAASHRSTASRDQTSRVLLLSDAAAQLESGNQRSQQLVQHPQQYLHAQSSEMNGNEYADDNDGNSGSCDDEGYASAVKPLSNSETTKEEDAEERHHYNKEYEESVRPNSTPRVEEGDYDEEPVYDEDNYAREMLTPALLYERR